MLSFELLQILLIATNTVGVAATIPQLIKIVKVKSSHEFSLQAYGVWTMTQAIALMYMIAISDPILIVTSAAWVTYYGVMTGLIIYYAQPKQIPAVEVAQEVDVDKNLRQPAATNVQ